MFEVCRCGCFCPHAPCIDRERVRSQPDGTLHNRTGHSTTIGCARKRVCTLKSTGAKGKEHNFCRRGEPHPPTKMKSWSHLVVEWPVRWRVRWSTAQAHKASAHRAAKQKIYTTPARDPKQNFFVSQLQESCKRNA